MSNNQKPLYFFLHIPKTGGTSLSDLLQNIYSRKHIRVLDENNHANRERVKHILKNEPDRYDVITAHVSGFGIHEDSNRPVRYITILRDPAARAISLYYKIIRNTTHRRHDEFKQYGSIENALSHIGANLQTRVIAGTAPDAPLMPGDLETAKHNLETWFDAVAILERFDESLLQMRYVMGWKRPVLMPPRKNVGSNRPKVIPENVLEIARHLNEYDVQLYRFANELLDKRIREMGFAFQRNVIEVKLRRTTRKIKAFIKQMRPRA